MKQLACIQAVIAERDRLRSIDYPRDSHAEAGERPLASRSHTKARKRSKPSEVKIKWDYVRTDPAPPPAGVVGIALLLATALLCPGLEVSIAPDPVSPVLTWANVRGQAYHIESAAHPASAWEPRVVRTGDHTALTWMDEEPASSRVYRILTASDPARFASLQQALELTRRNQRIVGAGAAAVLPGAGFWVGTSGYAHGSFPVQPSTRFEIGSVTKTIVASLALRMVEDGALGLDDSLSHWLPELRHSHIDPAITVRQLLNHRAGTYNFGDDVPFRQALFSDWDRMWQPEEVLDYLQAPYFPAGTDGQYSNTGYLLAGMVLRQAITTDLPTQMRGSIFEPSGMRSTFSGVEEGWTGDLAHPHLDFNGDGVHEDLGGDTQTAILSSFWTSGHVISTAADLARFGQALFDGTLLSPASLAAMTAFQPVDIGGSDYAYGLGLMRLVIDGVEYFAHSGGLFGEYAWFSYCPSTGVSLGIVYNYPQTTSSGPAFPLAMIEALAALQPGSAPVASLGRLPASDVLLPERLIGTLQGPEFHGP